MSVRIAPYRYPVALGLCLAAMLFTAACAAVDRPGPRVPPAPAATAEPPPAAPTPMVVAGVLGHRPLVELDHRFANFLESREGDIAVAVIGPGPRVTYTWNPDLQLPLNSGVKVVIMAAVLDLARKEGRPPTEQEHDLLSPMITWSDNDSATALWERLGGHRGINRFLRSSGLREITPARGLYWGDTAGSAEDVGRLMAQIGFGADLLGPDGRAYARDLLTSVAEEQRWGITAGLPSAADGAAVGFKNGWFPVDEGWEVNSSGFVVSTEETGNSYALAVLTAKQPSFEYAVETIEEISRLVHQALWRPVPFAAQRPPG